MISYPPSVVVAPVETAAEDAFDDPVVGGCGWSDADAEVDLPFGRDVQVDGREDLLLLVVEAGDVGDAAVVGVVFNASGNDLGEVPADFGGGREVEAEFDVGTVPCAFERGVDGPVRSGLAGWSTMGRISHVQVSRSKKAR